MLLESPTLSEPVEIDGVSFQTVISQAVIPIPEKVAGGETYFKTGLRITNNTDQDYFFFDFPGYLQPEVKLSSGRILWYGYDTDAMMLPRNSNMVLAESKKSVDILWNTSFTWTGFHKNIYKDTVKTKGKRLRGAPHPYPYETDPKLWFLFCFRYNFVCYYAYDTFPPIPDKFGISFKYSMNVDPKTLEYSKENDRQSHYRHIIPSIRNRLWFGLVDAPFAEIQIV